MKFSTREDIEVPINVVFEALTDFDGFERSAIRHGADVSRTDPASGAGVGMTWSVRFPVRGKMRRAVCVLDRYDPPTAIYATMESTGFEGDLNIELVALSRARTRLLAQFDIRPRNLSARLMIQTARLSRASHNKRFESRVQKFAAELELKQLKSRTT